MPLHSGESSAHILVRSGPATAGVPHAAILEICYRHSALSQRSAEVAGVQQVVLRPPESAVDHHRDGARRGRFPDIEELAGIVAVSYALVGRVRREREDIAHHDWDFTFEISKSVF